MSEPHQLADRFREVMLHGKWIANTNMKEQLSEVTLEQSLKGVRTLNSIAALTFHMDYYISGVLNVLKGGDLEIRDKYSFDLPTLTQESDWQQLRNKLWTDSEQFASLVEDLPRQKLEETFVDPKYGTYSRNIEAMIEHAYYHLGQIVLIKKLL